jgi:peptidoglycan hydrolase-like protein with peptidoglycan-binding domain
MTTKKKSSRTAETSKKKSSKAGATATEARNVEPTVTVTMAPDTAAETTAAAAEPTAAATTPAEKPPITVGMFQKRLAEAGYYDGAWDGHYGPHTKLWVARFQAAHNLPINGEPTTETLVALGL